MANYIPHWVYGKYTRIRLPFEVMAISFVLASIHMLVPCAISQRIGFFGLLLTASAIAVMSFPDGIWGRRAVPFSQHPRLNRVAWWMIILSGLAHPLLTH
jgi:hypothetical protein